MSLRRNIRKIIEAIDVEYLEKAQPAIDDSGMQYGGLVFVAKKDDNSEMPAYTKGQQFTLLDIIKNPDGSKNVRMARHEDGAAISFPVTVPFMLYGSDLKAKRNKDAKSVNSKKS